MPITLYGEGHYALTAIKSIRVTKDFLGLGERITNCQTEESRADCLSRKYRAKVQNTCRCAPFSLRSEYTEEVGDGQKSPVFISITYFQIRTCTSKDLVCVESLPAVNTEDCLELCEGTIVDVTKLASVREETVMDSFIREYELYKHQHSDNLRQGKII